VVDASDESRLPEAKAAFEEAVSHAYARVSAGATVSLLPPPSLPLTPTLLTRRAFVFVSR